MFMWMKMTNNVTVDLEDLETLIWATAAMKAIESALQARKQDPFVRPHLDFSAAHDRLAAAMRDAKRAEAGTLVQWDGELDADERRFLAKIRESDYADYITHDFRRNNPEIDRLLCKGMIRFGQLASGLLWAGEPQPRWSVDTTRLAVEITPRGMEKLKS